MKKNKLLAVFLALAMTLSLLPTAALAEGTSCSDECSNESHVAAIGTTHYTSLADAIAAVPTDGTETTVTLLQDVTLNDQVTIGVDSKITLDLSGKVITENGAGARKIVNNGTLKILDSSTTGEIKNATVGADGQDGSYGLVDNYGMLTIESGKFTDVAHGNGSSFRNRTNATLIINGGTFTSTADDANKQSSGYTGAANAFVYSDGTEVQINGGTFTMVNARYTPAIKITKGTATIDGATISTYMSGGVEVAGGALTIQNTSISVSNENSYYANALAVSGDGTANVLSGTYTGYKYGAYIYSSGGTFNISGGTFEAGTAVLKADKDVYAPYGATIHVSGGSFTGQYEINAEATLAITGGTFSSDPTPYVPASTHTVSEADSTFTVAARDANNSEAKIGDTYYATLANAIAVAPTDGTETTVTLLKNASVESYIWVDNGKNIVLNLNGHDVVSTSDFVFQVKNAKFRVTGTGTIFENTINGYAPIVAYGSGTDVANYTVITIDEKVTLKGDYTGIFVAKDAAGGYNNYGLVINMKGTIDMSCVEGGYHYSGLYVNGSNKTTTGNVMKINLDGATIRGCAGTGIYAAGYCDWTIDNKTSITGESTGIEIRAGKMTIGTASITGTAVPTGSEANGNGSTSTGAGLAIAQHTSKLPVLVTISDGAKIYGYTALYQANPQGNDAESIAKVHTTVSGGEFTAINGGTNAVYSENETKFITGGIFSSNPDAAYLADGCASAQVGSSYVVGSATHTVTFESNGGSAVAAIENVAHGTIISAPTAPTKEGYTFAGWYAGAEEYNFSTPVTGNVTLIAHWTLNTYTVTFESNGGSAVAAIKNVAHGATISAPTAPTRSGYTFAGWQLNSSDYEFSTPVTENITLIAKWTEIPSTPSDSDSSDDDRDFTTPSEPTTSTETKPDGSTTTTESKPDGTVTESNTSKPVTGTDGSTSQTTTETTTGKGGVTESKTETVTKPDGSASSTTESTTTKPDGTKTESTTETTINKDGSTASTTTETTTNKDGTVTESKTEATTSTVTNKDGSTTETKQETTTTSTGSKTESTTVTTVNKDGSSTATTTATTTDKAGTVTESKTESTTSKNGTTTEKTTTTETKANGTVTESTTETTTKANGTSSSTTTATTTKADGTTTTSTTTATTSLSTNKTTGTVTETKKETTTTSDGVKSEGTTVTQIQKDGTVTSTETVKASDSTGTTATKTTTLDAKGEVTTTAEVSVSSKAVAEAAKTGEAVTLPVEVPAAKTTEAAPTVQVTVPKSDSSVKVEIPVEKVTPGTVAVIVNDDGTEKIVSTSVVTENGVALTLDGSATVKLVDNSKSFTDVPDTNVFYNEISSLSAREIMIGKTEDRFDLHNSVTLNQIANVAGRITGKVDVNDFNAGIVWGNENGLKTGNVSATRGDVLKALYIAAGSPAVDDTSILARFKDSANIPADMAAIAAWAAQNGILKGNTDGSAGLGNNVTRGQACALAGRTMGNLA